MNAAAERAPFNADQALRKIEAAALRVASSRRNRVVTDQGPLDALDAALEARP